ncbi:2-oxoacid:ferredoxin oxidoreductase subunit beta [Candidatus Peregrinibacteria bacterium]|nr:2-oxoacid:ferredoxin oxidoreductase subunit beta [Candidatus Peregrinibacteria bacterium]
MTELTDLQTKTNPNWCPGCGDYGVQASVKGAIVKAGLKTSEVVISSGIGCGSKIPHWVKCYGFEGLHGRPLPVATGIKLANPELTVMAIGGDGDGYGLGMGHLIHSMRRNLDITYVIQDNQIYGLTTGQTSPTSEKGVRTKSTPEGAIEIPVNPIELGLASGATYIARGYAGNLPHLTSLIEGGLKHRGFALIDVFQPCVTFNKVNTYEYFNSRVYTLEDDESFVVAGPGDPDARCEASRRGREWGDKIPIGLFYREERPAYGDEEAALKESKPVDVPDKVVDIEELKSSFM